MCHTPEEIGDESAVGRSVEKVCTDAWMGADLRDVVRIELEWKFH